MKTKLLSIDIFLGERFFRTMFLAPLPRCHSSSPKTQSRSA